MEKAISKNSYLIHGKVAKIGIRRTELEVPNKIYRLDLYPPTHFYYEL